MIRKVCALAAISLAILPAAGLAQRSTSRSFCLSDKELDQSLVPVSLHKLGAMLDTCMRKYPNLAKAGSESNSRFYAKYSTDVDRSAAAATQIMTSHGATAVQIKEMIQAAQSVATKTAEAYDEKQCKNVVSFIEFAVASDSFAVIRTMAHTDDFPSARANIPTCASNPTAQRTVPLDEEIRTHNAKVMERTKRRCLLPKPSRLEGLDPLDAATFDLKCEQLGILTD